MLKNKKIDFASLCSRYDVIPQKIKNISNTLIILYASFTLLYQIVWLIAPLRAFMYARGLDRISSLLAVAGIVIVLWDVLFERVVWKNKYVKYVLPVICVLALSSLVNFRYGIVANVKVMIWQLVQMLVFFSLSYRIKKELHLTYLRIIHTAFSVIYVPCVAVSVYYYFFNVGYYVGYVNGTYHRQGLMDGRNFGVFASIYFVSLLLLVATIITVYLGVKTRNILLRAVYFSEAALFFVYLVSSGTRSIQIGLYCSLFVFSFVMLKSSGLLSKLMSRTVLKNMTSVALSVVCVLGAVLVYGAVEKTIHKIPVYIYNNYGSVGGFEDDGDVDVDIIDPDHMGDELDDDSRLPIQVDRNDVDSSNISNHRFTIWTEYLKLVFGDVKAALIGFGPGSYMNAIKEQRPDSFLVEYIRDNYPSMYSDGLIYDTHNCYLSVVVTTGILGVAALVLFFAFCIKKVFAYFFLRDAKPSATVLCLVMVVIAIMSAAFFDSDLFYKCTDTSLIFWTVSGFLIRKLDTDAVEQ